MLTTKRYNLTNRKWRQVKQSQALYKHSYWLIKMYSQEIDELDHTLNTNFWWFEKLEFGRVPIDIYRG